MPVFLKHRRTDLVEYMDREDCDPEKLANTYRQFRIINKVLSGWKRVYRKKLRPLMQEPRRYTLLDIGFGGGDIPLAISGWAKQDDIDLHITAIEIDDRALEFVQQLPPNPTVEFRKAGLDDIIESGQTFDMVICNHVLHHLPENELPHFLEKAKSLAAKIVLFSDIRRSDLGFLLFGIVTRLFFFNSFIIPDGLMSIRRSFTLNELHSIAPPGWQVERSGFFRLLVMME